jgi:DNA-binding NtrC family response regulator
VKPRILVVDDESVIAENLRLTLEREGYDVETAGNTVGAMLRMETREFALGIVDLILPDGDGLHLLRLLKAKDPSIEVIIMTGHGSISKAVEATKQGAFYFVAKPFDADEMLMLWGTLSAGACSPRHRPAPQAAEQAAYGEMSIVARHQRLRDAGVGGLLRRQRAHRGRERTGELPPTRCTASTRVDGPMVKIARRCRRT